MSLGPLLIGIAGTELDEASRKHLLHPSVGGVVLFTRNFSSIGQLSHLVDEIRSLRNPRLVVCIDQEGGRVQRLRQDVTALPPLGKLGKIWEQDRQLAQDYAYRHGRVMAAEMLGLGIDLSFAPVLDLDRGSCVIGDRSFSASIDAVTDLGRHYLAGMHDSGMQTTGKHFPGHGSIVADSHVDDVIDDRSLEEIQATDLRPFADLMNELDALMIAHVVYPQVDSVPAGYSRTWLKKILRQEMQYQGVIMSDDLGMHAAHVIGDLPARMVHCLEAGCDLVLVCRPEDVEELLPCTDLPGNDVTEVIKMLYGRPLLDGSELADAARQGAAEWQQWRTSLESINTGV